MNKPKTIRKTISLYYKIITVLGLEEVNPGSIVYTIYRFIASRNDFNCSTA